MEPEKIALNEENRFETYDKMIVVAMCNLYTLYKTKKILAIECYDPNEMYDRLMLELLNVSRSMYTPDLKIVIKCGLIDYFKILWRFRKCNSHKWILRRSKEITENDFIKGREFLDHITKANELPLGIWIDLYYAYYERN